MRKNKEKRLFERIPMPDVQGTVELSETVKPITVVNASEEGVCISGVWIEEGSVVRLAIASHQDIENFSLYCKVAWASGENEHEKRAGLSFLNTNRILFKQDLVSFGKLLQLVQSQLNP